MTETLFIYFSSPDPTQVVEATVVSSDGSVSKASFTTTLESVATSFGELPLVVLIPGSKALCTTAVLPKVRTSQIRRMLPFALEEQIAGELEQQHFAMGRPSLGTGASASSSLSVPVAVIQHQTLQSYLDPLRSFGLEPAQMLLDQECIAGKPGDVVAWVQGEEVFLRTPSGLGLRCRANDLQTTLGLLPNEPPMSTLGLQVVGTSLTEPMNPFFEKIDQRFARIFSTDIGESPLNWLVSQRVLADPINLLQGEWRSRRSQTLLSEKWRRPVALAATLLLLIVIDQANTWRIAAAEETNLNLAISQTGIDPDVSSTGLIKISPMRRVLLDLANAGVRDNVLNSIVMDGAIIRITLASGRSAEPLNELLGALGWRLSTGKDEQGHVVITLSVTDAGDAT
ncbi:MAG: hypothetical protein FJ196_02255 [Gammaproteobacteria bacterium]|nr:hypothetical protein [Gammaproteobacteria bacterium]